MNAARLIELFEDVGLDVHATYSGRGMGGKQCIGYICGSTYVLRGVAEIMYSAQDDHEREALVEVFRKARIDDMGRGVIIYFPHLSLTE